MKLYKYAKKEEPKQLVEFMGISDEQRNGKGEVFCLSHFRFNFVNDNEISSDNKLLTKNIKTGCETSVYIERNMIYNYDFGTQCRDMKMLTDNITKFYLADNHKLMTLCKNNAGLSQLKPNFAVRLQDCANKGLAKSERQADKLNDGLLREAMKDDYRNQSTRSFRGWKVMKNKPEVIDMCLEDLEDVNIVFRRNRFSLKITHTQTEHPATFYDPGDIEESIIVSVYDTLATVKQPRALFTIQDPTKEQLAKQFMASMEAKAEKENWYQHNRYLLERTKGVAQDFQKLFKNKKLSRNGNTNSNTLGMEK